MGCKESNQTNKHGQNGLISINGLINEYLCKIRCLLILPHVCRAQKLLAAACSKLNSSFAIHSKSCLKRSLKNRKVLRTNGYLMKVKVLQNALLEHSAILLTSIKG